MNKVHERITGYDTFSNFPMEEEWCIYHPKQIDRQEKQNEFYETIMKILVTGDRFYWYKFNQTIKRWWSSVEVVSLDNYDSGLDENHIEGVTFI